MPGMVIMIIITEDEDTWLFSRPSNPTEHVEHQERG